MQDYILSHFQRMQEEFQNSHLRRSPPDRGKVDVYLFEGRHQLPETNVLKLISWFQGQMDTIPEDCRHNATFEVDETREYGETYIDLTFKYWRWETDEEMGERLAKRAALLDADSKAKEEKDKRELARLKQQYEPHSGAGV
jgi:hypothetical protein